MKFKTKSNKSGPSVSADVHLNDIKKHYAKVHFLMKRLILNELPHDKTQQNDLCAQQTLGSAWASAQSDQSLRWADAQAIWIFAGRMTFCWFCHAAAQISIPWINFIASKISLSFYQNGHHPI